MSDEEKTHDPTDKKIDDTRKKGNVPKSQEVNGFIILLLGTAVIFGSAGYLSEHISDIFLYYFNFNEILHGEEFNANKIKSLLGDTGELYFYVVGPLFAVVFIFAIIANVAQFGILTNPLKLDFAKLNPISGIKNILSFKKLLEMVKMLLKILLGIFVFVLIIFLYKDEIVYTGMAPIDESYEYYRDIILILFSVILFNMFIFAMIDLAFVRYNYFQKLKMSEKEVRDEYKQMEGDPLIKQRIREIQHKMSSGGMMREVPTADFVVTNPTHYAVAMRYDKDKERAPKVVAKGIDHLALQIKLIARENNIPIIENPPLARSLHAKVDLDQEISEDFYNAIAELFVYINDLNQKK